MKREVVSIPGAPKPVGPFSPAIKAAGFVFVSGQLPLAGGSMPEGIVAQTRQSLENVKAVLEAAGTGLGNVVKCTVFMADMKEWPDFNAIYVTYFDRDRLPARSAFGANGLALGARVERVRRISQNGIRSQGGLGLFSEIRPRVRCDALAQSPRAAQSRNR